MINYNLVLIENYIKYTDGIVHDTPIIVRDIFNKHICLKRIQDLQLYSSLCLLYYDIWTQNGWVRIKEIKKSVKHVSITNAYNSECIINLTSNDFKLINNNKISLAKPVIDFTYNPIKYNLSYLESYLIGHFLRNGTCFIRTDVDNNIKLFGWKIIYTNKQLFYKFAHLYNSQYPATIITSNSKNKYIVMLDVVKPQSLKIVRKYYELLYEKEKKILSNKIFSNSSLIIKKYFVLGYTNQSFNTIKSLDKMLLENKTIIIDNRCMHLMQSIYLLLKPIIKNITVSINEQKKFIFELNNKKISDESKQLKVSTSTNYKDVELYTIYGNDNINIGVGSVCIHL